MTFAFDPDVLHAIANKAVGLPFDDMTRVISSELVAAYPAEVDANNDYIFNLTAGGCGMMKIFHGSITEYLIIFGSAIGTEAFSGRYRMDIHDFVLSGEMWTYTEQRCGERQVTKPGEHALLPRGKVKGWRLREGTWMLEYGRGFLPSGLPLILGDVLLSAMDWRILAQTLQIYGRLTTKALLRGKL